MATGGDAQQLSFQAGALPEDAEHGERISEKLMFATDEMLAAMLRPAEKRLVVVENFVADMKARLPGVERECEAIRQNVEAVREQLEPRSKSTDGLRPAA